MGTRSSRFSQSLHRNKTKSTNLFTKMKLFSIAAISAVALSSVEASRGRNKHMARSLDCSMNPEAPEQFIQCFYEKHASSVVDEKVTEYKRVASRITSALEKAGDNKKTPTKIHQSHFDQKRQPLRPRKTRNERSFRQQRRNHGRIHQPSQKQRQRRRSQAIFE